jgi:hypothetical protein
MWVVLLCDTQQRIINAKNAPKRKKTQRKRKNAKKTQKRKENAKTQRKTQKRKKNFQQYIYFFEMVRFNSVFVSLQKTSGPML